MMKAPYLPSDPDASAASGFGYAYADASSSALRWTGKQLDKTTNALGATLAYVYGADASKAAWLLYNDQPPTGTATDTYGHTKGVVSFDSSGGFWLVHSVPRFPDPTGQPYAGYPGYAKDYGQSFLCVTYNLASFNDIANAFLLNRPWVYDSNLPTRLGNLVPYMQMVLDKNWSSKVGLTNATQLHSAAGKPFLAFSKNAKADSDLYLAQIAPTLKTSLYVETWMNGDDSNKMPSLCKNAQNPYSAIDVRQVAIGSVTWPETKDHSKWAVSASSKVPVTCIGDTNRQYSQAKRGGGSVCVNDPLVYQSMFGAISLADKC